MGGEWGQVSEWSQENGLEWWVLQFDYHSGVQRLVRDLNTVYRDSPELWSQDSTPDGFSWIDANDAAGDVVSFLRFGSQESRVPVLACVCNFSAMPHSDYRLGLPLAGTWREVLNTDSTAYGGSGVGNLGAVNAVPKPWHGRPASATVVLPPLGVIWLTHD
jgi:1,4-alpha-glucan branching enzyme